MINLLYRTFSKRAILGTFLLLILIGEPTVGIATGIFTPPGIIIFFFLYLSLFHLFESIITRYNLVIYQVIFLTFAIYSVGVTGLLNKELTEYVLKPSLIITLIRIQASFFVVFAFYLLNRIIPRDRSKVLSIKQALILLILFVSFISLTGTWGFPSVLFALKTASVHSIVFGILAIGALILALKSKAQPVIYENRKFLWVIYFCIIMGAVPHLITFMILLITMILGGVFLLINKQARNHPL